MRTERSGNRPTQDELFPKSPITFDYGDQGRNWPGTCNKGLQSPIDVPYSHIMKTVDIDPRASLRFDYKRAAVAKGCKWTVDYQNAESSKLWLKLTGCDKNSGSFLY